MNKNRLEAFSDGVFAIIITIMVLELKIPEQFDFLALLQLKSIFFSYLISYVYVGIYWNNHHHLLHSMTKVNGKILWANLFQLFWLSIVPFATGWLGKSDFAKPTVTFYGFILLMCGVSFKVLQNSIIKSQGKNSMLKKAVGKDFKGILSLILYCIAIGFSFVCDWVSLIIYLIVALIWIVPDKRIENFVFND